MSVHEHVDITIIVNDLPVAVHKHLLTVKAILEAAEIDPETHVLVEIRGDERIEYPDLDQEIEVNESTRFETKVRTYIIFVNGRERRVDHRVLTFDEVVALDPNPPPPGPGLEYTVTFFDAVRPEKGTLIEGESVVIKDGTKFNVRSTNRS